MAFDRHMNLVLGDSEEFRKLPPKKGQEAVREQRRQTWQRIRARSLKQQTRSAAL